MIKTHYNTFMLSCSRCSYVRPIYGHAYCYRCHYDLVNTINVTAQCRNTINVTAQCLNITNATDIGENQSISGRISGFGW